MFGLDRTTPAGRHFEQQLRELVSLQVKTGYQHGRDHEDDGTDICDIALWNELGTVNTPARPFMAQSFERVKANAGGIFPALARAFVQNPNAARTLNQVGTITKDVIQDTIDTGDFAPNAPATIARKKSSKPLIDTGRMRQSVNFIIAKKKG